MAFRAGKEAWLKMDGVNGAGTVISGYLDSISWPQTIQQLETSTFGTTAKQFIPGLTDGDTVTCSGPYDPALVTIVANVKAAQAAGSSTSTLIFGPGGSVSGQASISAEAWVASYAPSATVGGRTEWALSMQVTGAVTNTTF